MGAISLEQAIKEVKEHRELNYDYDDDDGPTDDDALQDLMDECGDTGDGIFVHFEPKTPAAGSAVSEPGAIATGLSADAKVMVTRGILNSDLLSNEQKVQAMTATT